MSDVHHLASEAGDPEPIIWHHPPCREYDAAPLILATVIQLGGQPLAFVKCTRCTYATRSLVYGRGREIGDTWSYVDHAYRRDKQPTPPRIPARPAPTAYAVRHGGRIAA